MKANLQPYTYLVELPPEMTQVVIDIRRDEMRVCARQDPHSPPMVLATFMLFAQEEEKKL